MLPYLYRSSILLSLFYFCNLGMAREAELLRLKPISVRPTSDSIMIQARNGDNPVSASLRYRKEQEKDWDKSPSTLDVKAGQFIEWRLKDLEPGVRYVYEVELNLQDKTQAYPGAFITTPKSGGSFTAAIIADSHIGPFKSFDVRAETLNQVARSAAKDNPDFTIALGDNVAWPGSKRAVGPLTKAKFAYSAYRNGLESLTQVSSYFGVIGNWEGENGIIPEKDRRKVAALRKQYMPGPDHNTYKYGGSINEDYYAFDWGDALFVVLNVQSYSIPSRPASEIPKYLEVAQLSDWTLGVTQFSWFKHTIENSNSKFKFVFIHHAVGGYGGNERETLYGRGGGRAYNTGEQAKLHELAKSNGVQAFFLGHDHVFTDMVVDGIHYTIPGSAGMDIKFSKDWTGYGSFLAESGYATLKVTPDSALVEFKDVNGKAFQSFSMQPNFSQEEKNPSS